MAASAFLVQAPDAGGLSLDVAIPSFVTAIVDGGIAGAALTCVLVASAVPTMASKVEA